jgi:Glycosyltransferase 61
MTRMMILRPLSIVSPPSSMAVIIMMFRIALVLSIFLNGIAVMILLYHHQSWSKLLDSTSTTTSTTIDNNNKTKPFQRISSTFLATTTATTPWVEIISEKQFDIGNMSLLSSKCKVVKNVEFILTNYSKHAVVESLSDLTMKFHHPALHFHNIIQEHYISNPFSTTTTATTATTTTATSNKTTMGYATCVRKKIGWEEDFPHWFQQISRCWSFWQMHSHLRSIWMTDSDHPKYNSWIRRLIDLMPTMGILPILYNQTTKDVHVITGNFERLTSINLTTTLLQVDSISLVQVQQQQQQHDHPINTNNDASVTAYSMPTWPSQVGFQSTSIHHMMTFRKEVLNAIGYRYQEPSQSTQSQQEYERGCQPGTRTTPDHYQPIPRIAMINRKKTRKLLNGWEILVDWKNQMNLPYDIPEYYLEGMTFDQQVTLMAEIDILITPHGAQETNLVFMPPCGGILEVIPDQYFVPKYYGTLAASTGHDHAILYLADHLEIKTINGTTNKQYSMCVPLDSTRYGILRMVERWQNCCHRLSFVDFRHYPSDE